jgi:hypothetical protein
MKIGASINIMWLCPHCRRYAQTQVDLENWRVG